MKTIFHFLLFCCYAIFAQGQAEEANLLGTWSNPNLVGSNAHNNTYNEIWGVSRNGHEYAIIGSTLGTHFIDVTDPENPFEAHLVIGRTSGASVIHRDFHEHNGFLYSVSDQGGNSLQIIDMRSLPDVIFVTEHDVFSRAHNIFIDTLHARLYTLSLTVGIFDISNPLNPIEIGRYLPSTGSRVHDGYIEDHIGFINNGNNGLEIVDFTNPAAPEIINVLEEYPFRGFNHSGWVNQDKSTYYFADENHGSPLKAMDISNLCDLEVETTFDAQVANPTSIPHNLIAACDFLYVSYYYDGLRIYDISNPLTPTLVSFYDTFLQPDRARFEGAWGIYPFLPSGNILISDMQSGLFVFEGMGDNCSNQTNTNSSLQNQVCTTTSTNDLSTLNTLSVHPNPTTDYTSLIVNLSTTMEELNVSLINLNGQRLKDWQFNNLVVGKNDLSILLPKSLPEGLYFLSLRNEQIQFTQKLLVQPKN